MYKTILVPLDGSSRAEEALPIAARIARNTGASVVLVRIVSVVSDYWPPPSLRPRNGEDGGRKQATHYLEKIAASSALADLETQTTTRHGTTASEIVATATGYHADLIVMSSHGHSGAAHWIRGGTAEKVSQHAPVPVLVVRSGTGPAEVSQPLRILVPLDGTVHAKMALEPAATLLTALAEPSQKCSLHLVRVVHLPTVRKDDEKMSMQRELTRAKRYLKHNAELIQEGYIAPTIARQHIPVSWSVALDTDIAGAILRVAENGEDAEGIGVFGGCDLIAIATHAREGLQRWAMGSVTEDILHAARRSLLIVRPQHVTYHKESIFEQVSFFRE